MSNKLFPALAEYSFGSFIKKNTKNIHHYVSTMTLAICDSKKCLKGTVLYSL